MVSELDKDSSLLFSTSGPFESGEQTIGSFHPAVVLLQLDLHLFTAV